jgi:hypothetical protein
MRLTGLFERSRPIISGEYFLLHETVGTPSALVNRACLLEANHAAILLKKKRSKENMKAVEPGGFTIRPATLSDVPTIYSLLQSHERALYGYTDKILAYVQATYSQPSLDFAGDTCLIFDRGGQLVGSISSQAHGFFTKMSTSPASLPEAVRKRY